MQNIRGGRHTALYGDEEELDEDDLTGARRNATALLDAVHRRIVSTRPALAKRLAAPPRP